MTEQDWKKLDLLIIKRTTPRKIKGSESAADILDISASALRNRMANGFYLEGVHYVKKSDRIIVWDRNALLAKEFQNELQNRG